MILKTMMLAAATSLLAMAAAPTAAQAQDTILMETTKGPVTIRLRPDIAPQHAARIKELAADGFYDGIIFHRVIDGFMAQTGDPTGTGMGGSDKADLPAEFSSEPFVRGTIGMARSNNPNSANSQFFIMFDEGSFLNGQYTVIGEVVDGMDTIDAINKGEPPRDPDSIVSMRLQD